MSYKESIDYLYTQLPMFQRVGPKAFKKNLDNIQALAKALGNPEKEIACIHVAGTNGKGTTSHMIAAVLQKAGYKVGLYTSPHYKDFRERIKINREFIDKRYVSKFVEWFKTEASFIPASFFEITVAMAFDYFRNEKIDIAIIETGLGGRLDSTNIVDPLLSVITNISFDHTNFLGDRLELIAAEKAGIIKKNRPVVIGRKQDETAPVFKHRAKQNQAELFYAEDIVSFNHTIKDTFELDLPKSFKSIQLKDCKAPFYLENLQTSLAALAVLQSHSSFCFSPEDIQYGLNNVHELTYYIGRWMLLGDHPLIIGDSAHNPDGLSGVLDHLSMYKRNKIHFVLGFVNDKDLSKVLPLFPENGTYYFAKAKIPRGLEALDLQNQAAEFGLKGKSYSSVRRAYAAARKRAEDADLIYIGGSIFTLAEVV